ncbi:hypothetical protein M9H77_30512 [Catharanthus roseus]|uniref:Uncharacterized protein n=1 Tax=Catharanthus roseus TaxID=4058 RepID=A0ACB9ZYI0_CATRO|nr:hypothetical protein M9H77_30512 [Catharanthus roseus]
MLVCIIEALKKKDREFDGHGYVPSCLQSTQLIRRTKGTNLEQILAKYGGKIYRRWYLYVLGGPRNEAPTTNFVFLIKLILGLLYCVFGMYFKSRRRSWERFSSNSSSTRGFISIGLIMFTDDHMPTQSHQEGPSGPSRMNLNKTLRSMQQSIEGLARQFQSVARDVEELKKGKSSAIMK